MKRTVACLAVLFTLCWSTHPLWACGGLFCSTIPGPTAGPTPVDQTAERIIFEVDEVEGTVTAHVQIQYTGDADAFAWIVPVPNEPEVAESDAEMFQRLDEATALSVTLPPAEPCNFNFAGDGDGGGGDGCGCSEEEASAGSDYSPTSLDAGVVDAEDPVTVYAHDYTTNYEYDVIAAEETQDLIDWLQENEYNVSDNMRAVMEPYNEAGNLFLAVKLRDGREASDIVPIRFTYVSDRPAIPLQLTAVAAQPLMGILVFIVSVDAPFVPANYAMLRPDTSEIAFNAAGATNYFEWVARKADEMEGRLFVAESLNLTPLPVYAAWTGAYADAPWVSRFYTRMSPHRMTLDPVFQPTDQEDFIGNTLSFVSRPAVVRCGATIPERQPSQCAFNYCGEGAECSVVNGNFACDCADGEVAQYFLGPDQSGHVTCVPESNPYGITPEAGGAGTPFDPCAGTTCGDLGTCVLRSGFPSCDCNEGTAAIILDGGRVTCTTISNPTTFGPGAGPESNPTITTTTARETPSRPSYAWGWVPIAAAIVGLRWMGKRRR